MNALVILLSALLDKPAMDAEFKESDHPRDKDGKFDSGGASSGEAGESTGAEDISITGNELGSYADAKELRQKAMKYYQDNLQKNPAHRDDIGEIRFSRKGMEKTRSFSGDTDKLLMFPALRGIIETGTLGKEENPDHPRKDGIVKFIPITKRISFKGAPKDVEVLLGKDRNGNLYYDLFLDNSRKKESSASGVGTNLRLAEDSATGVLPAVEINIRIIRPRVNGDRIAFDRASQRRFDENGFLHVAMTPISKEAVNDYYGYEIPGWQKLGLDPNRIYKGYRPAMELAKAATTFNGLPLLKEHVKISAEDLKEELRAGNLGTAAKFVAPYLYNALIIQDAESIEGLNPKDGRGAKCELSSSYRYDPVFKSGVFQGQRYDFVMTNIRGNHVALVEEGRAGPDVVVADAKPITPRGNNMSLLDDLKELLAKLTEGGATPHPGGEEEAAAFMDAGDEENAAVPAEGAASDDEAGDLGTKLFALIDGLEDKELAAKLKELVDQARAESAPVGDEDTPAEDEDEPGEKEKDKPAMDSKKKRPAYKTGPAKIDKKTGNVVINMAMDAKAVAAEIRDGFKAQIEAARDVRPLIGDVDPLAFDSAAGIYGKALELIGKPSKLTDPKALKELCALAADAKRGRNPYPVVSSVLANDSKGDADPNFANLGAIRKA